MKKDKLKKLFDEATVETKTERETYQHVDLLDVLLDSDNKEPIILLDENGRKLTFDQVAVIPHEDSRGEKQLFALLKPLDKLQGIADDEMIVFRASEDENGNTTLVVEEDEDIWRALYVKYLKLLREHGVKCPDGD